MGLETKDWIMVAAIIIGPILAVQIQRLVDIAREKRAKRMRVFYTLMSTRANKVSHSHVEALNMIDIEFYGRRIFGIRFQSRSHKAVTNSWKTYNDHLNDRNRFNNFDVWLEKCDDLFAALLYNISQALGYDFDEVQIKRDCYKPIAHGDSENQQAIVMKGLSEVFSGKRRIPIEVQQEPSPTIKREDWEQYKSDHA